ncbi:ral guanine nucleotide dissociation stimulator-like [Rattus rattus]|uniref:ral guanine nucleotide dissociation stimulator-like n=1 Tax=Rattus rattus TaxID=10117 RepID=UPI0013F373A7|nr:ral guanine nucleotide dissociation stimulator-like [Rattus rattus]
MFSCCLQTTRASSLKKDNRESHDGVWRHRVHSCHQRLWPFSQMVEKLTKVSQGRDYTDQNLMETQREAWIRAQTLVEQMNTLVPFLQERQPLVALAFLTTYRTFVTPRKVLDLLYAYLSPYSKDDAEVKSILCSFLETWMDRNPEDFYDASDLLPLKYLKGYMSVYMPQCDLSVRVKRLLTQLEEEHTMDSQAKDEEDSDLGRHTSSEPRIEWV